MNLECPGVRDLLPLYEEGALEASEARAVRAHLELCPACRAEVELSAESWSLFRQAHAPVPAPDFRAPGPFAEAAGPSWFSPAWSLGLAAAAFLLGVAVGRRAPDPRPSPPPAAVSAAPAPAPAAGLPDLPLVLGDATLSGRPALQAPPVWADSEIALKAKPVARPGPSGLPAAPMLGAGASGLSVSPRAADAPSGLLVTPPVGARRTEAAEGVRI